MEANTNPFSCSIHGRPNLQHIDAESRIRAVQTFTFEQCRRALELPGIQKTVVTAIRRRMNKIQFGSGTDPRKVSK